MLAPFLCSLLQVGVQRGQGLEPLLDFLCHSFNAGTDVDAPMAQALRRLADEEWRDADVVRNELRAYLPACLYAYMPICLLLATVDLSHLSLQAACLTAPSLHDALQLLITDGQFNVPAQELLDQLQQAQWELGLEVHGLLVGVEDASEGLKSISTHIHAVTMHSNAPATVRSSAAR